MWKYTLILNIDIFIHVYSQHRMKYIAMNVYFHNVEQTLEHRCFYIV